MFFHNINPDFIQIGSIHIRWYGLVYFLGFLSLYFILRYLAKSGKVKTLEGDNLEEFMLYLIIGVIAGARILDFVFYNPSILFSDPLEVFRIWNGGMSYHGGLIGAMVAIHLFAKKHKASFNLLADIVALPTIFFLALGRIANFINGELWGTLSNSSFCVDYSQSQFIANPPVGCRHPYQIYESLKNFAVFFVLLIMKGTGKLKEGLLFWWFILLYNFLRIFADIFRDEPVIFAGLKMGQILSIIFSALAVYYIYRISSSKELNKKTSKV